MIPFPYQADLAELCSRLGMLAMLLLGTPMSAATEPSAAFGTQGSTSAQLHQEIVFSASASTVVDLSQVKAALKRARTELQLANKILGHLDARDNAADEYVTTVRQIVSWIDRPNADLMQDAPALATSLEGARLRFAERTSSLDHWLTLNRSAGDITVIPPRFVVEVQPESLDVPDYQARRLARSLLA